MKLTVKSATESRNGGFVITFKGEATTVQTVFGVNKTSTPTFCYKLDEALPVGNEYDVNLDDFVQQEYEGSSVKWLVEKK